MRSQNNLKQIVLAVHQVGSDQSGFIGGVAKPDPRTLEEANQLSGRVRGGNPLYWTILTLDGPPSSGDDLEGLKAYLVSPADPSDLNVPKTRAFDSKDVYLGMRYRMGGPSSYAYNMVAFTGPPRFPDSFRDGTSNTIAFSERYYERYYSPEPDSSGSYETSWLAYADGNFARLRTDLTEPRRSPGTRRPSFADAGWGDVLPITIGGVTRPSVPGATFQVRPEPKHANAYQLQTPFSAGLPVAMFDGSVRVVGPGVVPEAFWAAVTPNAGEVGTDF